MRRSRFIGLLVTAAVVLCIGLVVRNISWKEITVPLPPRGAAAGNPFYAAQRFAEALGARSEWRRVLGTTPSPDGVIVLAYWNWSLIEQRRRQLEQWVEAGGRLIIDESLIGGEKVLERWSGLARVYKEYEADEELNDPLPPTATDKIDIDRLLQTPGPCMSLDVAAPRPSARNSYALCNAGIGSWLSSAKTPSWALVDEEQMQAARVDIGRGSVTMINARPFGNRALFNGDHGLLFVAAAQLRRGDSVYFLSEERSTSLLALLWKYGAPVVLLSLCLVVLALWRGGLRFGPLADVAQTARRSLAEQIRGTGRFTLRFGAGRALHAAAVRALQEAAVRHIARYSSLQSGERIGALGRMTGIEATALAHALDGSVQRRATELRTAVTLLETARRKLLSATQ